MPRWSEGIQAFLRHAFPTHTEKIPNDPLVIQESLSDLLRGAPQGSITCVDADFASSTLIFRAVDVSDEDGEGVMRFVIGKILDSPRAAELRVPTTFRLVGLLRE